MRELLFTEALSLWESKNLSALKKILADEQPADIAELLETLEEEHPKSLAAIYRLLPKDLAAEVFVELDANSAQSLILTLSDKELAETLSELFYDDAADLIEEMPAGVVKRILKNSSPADREEINKLLKFEKNSAGSIMTTEFVRLKKEMTVADALSHIREVAIDKETVYTCYVTGASRRLEGIISARTLLTAPTDQTIGSLMQTHVIYARTDTDREEVARTLAKYGLLALPVVDSQGLLVGIVTVDDAIEVLREETEEDFAVMAAITPVETPYLKLPVLSIFRSRIPWLTLLMLTSTFTGMIISSFESALAAKVALTMFIPMLMGTGGNCGSQSSITVIRALSLGEIKLSDALRVLYKELRVALLCSIALAVMMFVKIMTVDRLISGSEIDIFVALIVSLTLIVTVCLSKLIGAALPIAASKVGLDPAVMASPFVTTLVDTLTLLAYFVIASMFI